VYEALDQHSSDVNILIPPRKNAHIWQHGNSKGERHKRDENLRYIRKYGRKTWKEDSGYHIRSLAELVGEVPLASTLSIRVRFYGKFGSEIREELTNDVPVFLFELRQYLIGILYI
jgi:hypothetical protein